MLNCFSGVFTLTATHKIEGQNLFVVAQSGDDLPTLCFMGKQKDTIVKWGKPGRMVAVAGALRTKIVTDGSKMTFVEVAYSRFLDKSEAEAVAPAKAAKTAKAPETVKVVTAAAAPDNNDELPC